MVLETYLKFQFGVCTEGLIPLKHILVLVVLTTIVGSPRYVLGYSFFVGCVLTSVRLSETFPRFSSRYISYLRKHSDTSDFTNYCGNSFFAIRGCLGLESNLIQTVLVRGVMRIVMGCRIALGIEHLVCIIQWEEIVKSFMYNWVNDEDHCLQHPYQFNTRLAQSLLEQARDFFFR